MTVRTRTALVVGSLGMVVPLALTACGNDGQSERDTLYVHAAASLTTTFTELVDEYESEHDQIDVELNLGGSADLASQIRAGAPADVFASADTPTMDALVSDGDASDPQVFASNVLEIATPAGNPAEVSGFDDLDDPDLKVVICAPEVPCGRATEEIEQSTGVDIDPVSEEQSVTDVLGKVSSGEADAGLVYVTDIAAAGEDVTGVPFPESDQVVNDYPIAPLTNAEASDAAQEFIDFVLSDHGQQVMSDAGFGAP